MLAFLLLILVTACYGRSLKDFNAPTLVGRDRDEHGCLTNLIYCNYTDKCIRVQEKCTPPVSTLQEKIEPQIKPKTRPTIKERINVYEIEI